MRKIYKYPVHIEDEFMLAMPEEATLLRADVQGHGGAPQLWALVDPNRKPELRRFRVIGTGHPIRDAHALSYVDTFMLEDGALVFHLFEKHGSEPGGEE